MADILINVTAEQLEDMALNGLKMSDVEQKYDPKSENPQSGIAVAEALQNVEIDIDNEMSDTSENPVQNKVIKDYVDASFSQSARTLLISILESAVYETDVSEKIRQLATELTKIPDIPIEPDEPDEPVGNVVAMSVPMNREEHHHIYTDNGATVLSGVSGISRMYYQLSDVTFDVDTEVEIKFTYSGTLSGREVYATSFDGTAGYYATLLGTVGTSPIGRYTVKAGHRLMVIQRANTASQGTATVTEV